LAIVPERSEHEVGLLSLGRASLAFQNGVHDIVFKGINIYSCLFAPLLDLLVSGLGEGSVIIVKKDGLNALLLVESLKHFQIVPMEKVQLAFQFLNVPPQFLQALDHKLHAVVGKVRVLLGVDLRWVEDEDWSDLLVLADLPQEGGIIDDPKVAVEEEDIHIMVGSGVSFYLGSADRKFKIRAQAS
jgi:hypothetical protein